MITHISVPPSIGGRTPTTAATGSLPPGPALPIYLTLAVQLALVLLVAGCGPATEGTGRTENEAAPSARPEVSPPSGDSPRAADQTADQTDEPSHPVAPDRAAGPDPPANGELPPESWETQLIGGTKVGHGHFTAERIAQDGEPLWRLTSNMKLELQRFGQSVTQQMKYTSLETPTGDLRALRVDVRGGGAAKVIEGRREGDQLVLQVTTQGRTETSRLDWDPAWGGFFAAELSMFRRPLEPGETRTLRSFAPLFNQVGVVELKAGEREVVELAEGSRRLLPVESTMRLGSNEIRETLWVDEQGQKQKSILTMGAGIDLITYRTSQAEALRAGGVAEFDLGDASIVSVSRPLETPHRRDRIVYRATLPGDDIHKVFVSGGSQQVRVLDDTTAEVTVRAVLPDDPARLADPGAPPADAERGPNNLIQSDDPGVRAVATSVAPEETDPWAVARALEQHVHSAIERKNFSQAFATAAEVCESLEGDCTEHAVFLAALCRARDIPARVAIGLVYYPQARGFAYHMWNEVWIRDRWVPLDATLGLGRVGPAHLKLAQSSLQGANAYSAFLPVFQVLGKLQLEVQSVE